VHVEVNVGAGLPALFIVGLPATVVKESKERVRAALDNSGFRFPAGRITVNLAPADLPKEGGRFDLPIALGILLASGQLVVSGSRSATLAASEFYGELALSGELKSTRGLLLAAAHAAQAEHELIVPRVNVDEVCRVGHARVRAAAHLLDVCAHLEGRRPLEFARPAGMVPTHSPSHAPDLAEVRGQWLAKRAVTIAAAGGHSLLMVGVPGAGKSSLARTLPGLLPPLSEAESLEVAAIASVSPAGFDAAAFGQRPFRAPHHTASAAAIIGGGSRACPGEISLAHHGVLFLDELSEFDRRVLEALREPLETGEVAIARTAVQARYPAEFQLVAAMNPCPCGYLGDPRGTCHCSPDVIQRYRSRISGPLLDRLDLQIEVPRVPAADMEIEGRTAPRIDSGSVAPAIRRAREMQLRRQGTCNARLRPADLMRCCSIDRHAAALIERVVEQLGLSARGYHRILRLARTIADLASQDGLSATHVAEAISLRKLDRRVP
jgi:magnesium chelatase family protein